MKILLCASEAAPYAKTGGLADVIGALPKALKQNGQDVRVIMPYYKNIKEQQIAYYQGYAYVRIGSQTEYVGVFHAICDVVDFYFIDNDRYSIAMRYMAMVMMVNDLPFSILQY